jgi:hypothetical protein
VAGDRLDVAKATLAEILAKHRTAISPAVLSSRLLAWAAGHSIVDGVAFLERAYASLPQGASHLVAGRPRVLARMHLHQAHDSHVCGYPTEAWDHLKAVAKTAPLMALRLNSLAIALRRLAGNDTRHNHLLLRELVELCGVFALRGIDVCVTGTLATSIHAGRFIKRHGDIDFVVPSNDDFERALAFLTGERGYHVTQADDWHGRAVGSASGRFRELRGANGLSMDLAYLPGWPVVLSRIESVQGVELRVVDLRELRNNYVGFMLVDEEVAKRQGDKNAILAIDRLLGRPPTLAVTPADCDRFPRAHVSS